MSKPSSEILDRYVSIGNEGRVLHLGPVETAQLEAEVMALTEQLDALKREKAALAAYLARQERRSVW